MNDAATFDCAGTINTSCQTPSWKHSLTLRYSKDWFTVGMRWRHIGALDYVNTNGTSPKTETSGPSRRITRSSLVSGAPIQRGRFKTAFGSQKT